MRYCIAPLQCTAPPALHRTAPHCTLHCTALQFHLALQVKSDRLHFLLVSPEAVAGGGGAFGTLLPHLPPIVFVCIDEAHCVWVCGQSKGPSCPVTSQIVFCTNPVLTNPICR